MPIPCDEEDRPKGSKPRDSESADVEQQSRVGPYNDNVTPRNDFGD